MDLPRINTSATDLCLFKGIRTRDLYFKFFDQPGQNPPYAQSKLVSCTKGTVIDVAVDIRKGSPTFGQWVSVELSEENHRQFFIPQGFAHGFLTLTDNVEFRYKVDNVYNKESEGGMRYDDPTCHVDWGSLLNGIEPVLSEKDQVGPTLEESNNQFVYEGE